MDYTAIRIAILLWLVRPQDWLSGFAGFGFMSYAMIVAIVGVARRPTGLQISEYFRSPSDWFVAAYLIWITYSTGDWFNTAKALVPFAGFYFCTALVLNSMQRLRGFLTCWVIGLAVVSVFALSTAYGMELAPGSGSLTDSFAGRLTLNTWIYNNPNALGHGVVALIPLAYVWLIWKRSAGSQLMGFVVICLAASVAYETQSKGAYICGAAAIVVGLLFKRSRFVQFTVIIAAMTLGIGALKLLPRMETLDDKEAGIAGRLIIWQMAHNAMSNTFSGEGWKKFEAWVDTTDYGLIRKATHGSYVNVGADLGYPGLFLFVAILYAGARTLWMSRPQSDPADMDADRCQRALLSLLASYVASAWMIDRAYHTDYFILAGAIAAFHRLVTYGPEELSSVSEGEHESLDVLPQANGTMALLGYPQSTVTESGVACLAAAPGQTSMWTSSAPQQESWELEENVTVPPWKKLDSRDFLFISVAFIAVLKIWEKIMTDFIAF